MRDLIGLYMTLNGDRHIEGAREHSTAIRNCSIEAHD